MVAFETGSVSSDLPTIIVFHVYLNWISSFVLQFVLRVTLTGVYINCTWFALYMGMSFENGWVCAKVQERTVHCSFGTLQDIF